jgi:(R,R)-butanediol dehydrogenase/meso-butanediol dehydrogenase/diacetyl reductase
VRAARWHGRGDVRVEDVPQPVPGPGELLLHVSWCGICGTDLEEYLDGPSIIPVEVPNGLTGRVAPLTWVTSSWVQWPPSVRGWSTS